MEQYFVILTLLDLKVRSFKNLSNKNLFVIVRVDVILASLVYFLVFNKRKDWDAFICTLEPLWKNMDRHL